MLSVTSSQFGSNGVKSIAVVPNLGYRVSVAFSSFNITVDATGTVTSLNTAAATGAGNTLTFNTTTIDVETALARRLPTDPKAFKEVLGPLVRRKVRVILEASTMSRWVAAELKKLKMEVVVVDPRRCD